MISKDTDEFSEKNTFGRKKESIVLQDRDFEIFIWLLDQKFSDLEVLKRKFFPKDGESLGGVRTMYCFFLNETKSRNLVRQVGC